MNSIVLVDDDEDLLEMMCYTLRAKGFKMTCLKNVENLQQVMSESMPDLLVLDIYINKDDGKAVCKKLKGSDDFKKLPVILYSAGNISPQSIIESGADDFVSKPFDVLKLISKINKVLNN